MVAVKDLNSQDFGLSTKKALKDLLTSRNITLRGKGALSLQQATNYIKSELMKTDEILKEVSDVGTTIKVNTITNEAEKIVIDQKKFLKDYKNKPANIQYKGQLTGNDIFSGIITFDVKITFSDTEKIITSSIEYNGNVSDIGNEIDYYLSSVFPPNLEIEIISCNTIPSNNSIPLKYNFADMTLSDTNDNLVIEKYKDFIMYLNGREGKNTCVYDFLVKHNIKKHRPEFDINKYDRENIKLSTLIDDLELFGVPISIYDINANKLKDIHCGEKYKRIPKLYCIIHNNHLYPLHKSLNFIKVNDIKIIYEQDCTTKLLEMVNRKIEPYDVILKYKPIISDMNVKVTSFKTSDSMYISDESMFNFIPISRRLDIEPDYSKSPHSMLLKRLREKYSLLKKNVGNGVVIEEHVNLYSTIPESYKFIKSPIVYRNTNVKAIYGRDGNSFYLHVAKTLPFLIHCNYINSEPEVYRDGDRIVDENLYLCEPIEENFLVNDRNIYSGIFLNLVKNEFPNIKFRVLEFVRGCKMTNVLKLYIDDIQNTIPISDPDWKVVKVELTKMFGLFNVSSEKTKKAYIEYEGIFTNFEMNIGTENYDYYPINEKYNLKYRTKTQSNSIRTMKPVGFMIMDFAKLELMRFMKINGIKMENIAQIKTDSIYTNIPFKTLPSKVIGEFKEEIPNVQKLLRHCPLSGINPNNNLSLFPSEAFGGNASLILQYAGAGKTYTIINKIIPENPNYIVLCTRHKALDEYRTAGLNHSILCGLVDKTFMEYDTIIVDEVGLVDKSSWFIIINLILSGKKVICYGDFNQFPEIENKFNEPSYSRSGNYKSTTRYSNNGRILPRKFGALSESIVKYLFKDIDMYETYVNRRNDFSIEYYRNLFNDIIDPIEEIKKHSKPLESLDFSKFDNKTRDHVITYTKDERNRYNNKIMKMLGYPIIMDEIKCKSKGVEYIRTELSNFTHKGVRIIADLTDNRDARKDGNIRERNIYNGMIYIIDNIDGQYCTLSNGSVLLVDEIERYFQPAYAINIHKLQGIWVSNFHFPIEESLSSYKMLNILAYVTISRIKTKY